MKPTCRLSASQLRNAVPLLTTQQLVEILISNQFFNLSKIQNAYSTNQNMHKIKIAVTKCVIVIVASSVPRTFKKSTMRLTFRHCAFLLPNVLQTQTTQPPAVIQNLYKEKSLNQERIPPVCSQSLSTSWMKAAQMMSKTVRLD